MEDILVTVDLDSEELHEVADQERVAGAWLRVFVGMAVILFAIVAFSIDISIGYYPLKLFILGSVCLLLLSPQSYPYLLGLAVFMYFELKTFQAANPATSYMIQAAYVICILMALGTFLHKSLTGRQQPYKRFDLASACLLGWIIISIFGFFTADNPFLYARRFLEILGFACAFYVGRSYLRTLPALKLLLFGLSLGLIAFIMPWTIGLVFRRGLGILGSLHRLRLEVGISSPATESGIVIMAFAFAYSLSASGASPKTKLVSRWLVALPAVIAILLYLSRAAIILIPVTIALTLFFSGRRLAVLWTLIISVIAGALIWFYLADLSVSIQERMATMRAALDTRQAIWALGIKEGITHPLLGLGAGQFPREQWYHAHNDEINVFAEHGIFALLFYILFWIYLVYATLKLLLSKNIFLKNFAGCFVVVMAGYFIFSQVEPMYFNRGGLLFAFLAGMMTKLYHQFMAGPIYEGELTPEFEGS